MLQEVTEDSSLETVEGKCSFYGQVTEQETSGQGEDGVKSEKDGDYRGEK